MFLRAFLLLALILPYPFARAQDVRNPNPFPESVLMATGVNYYPHQWPQDQWTADFKNMAKLGIEFVNMGDKAWSSWQRGEDNYSFIGIEEAVNLAGLQGLKVVITIPATSPPTWLRKTYENIANSNMPQFSNDIYKNSVQKLVKGLARKFAQNPYVSGWVFASVSPEQWQSIDRSQFAEKQFQDWLSQKYGSIDSLNVAWGLGFVAEPFNSFGEIQLPLKGDFQNPLIESSYREFRIEELQEFNIKNIRELSAYIPENQWISLHVQEPASFRNPWEYDKLDFLSWSRKGDFNGYPDAKDLARLTAFYKSFYDASGSIGFATENEVGSRYTPKTEKIALFQALASGNHFVSPYRYRQPRFHLGNAPASIVKRDGKTLTGYGKTYKQFIEELAIIRDKYPKIPEMPADLMKRRAAIVYSPQQLWQERYHREMESWDYLSHLEGYLRVFKSMGCPVKFIQEDQEFDQYNVLVVAGYESIRPAFLERLKKFAKAGGNVIFTARSDSKNKFGTYLDGGPASNLASFIGAKVTETDQIPNNGQSKINARGKSYVWDNWGEVLELSGSIPLATHGAQHYTGRAAASFKTSSRGSVSYFGFDTDSKLLEQDLMRKVFERMRISYDRMSLGMAKEWRDGFWFALNYGKESQRVPMDPYARIYLGSLDIGRGEICAWREKFRPGEDTPPSSVPAPTPKVPKPTADKDKPSNKKGKKGKKEKVRKVTEKPEAEKSLFEQTMEKRKKKN